MRERRELIAAFRQTALVNLLLPVAMIVLCAYLIQRALLLLTSAAPSLLAWSPEGQVSLAGLQFRYALMTIAWPLVVGAIALAFSATHTRMQRIGGMLAGDPRGLPDTELWALAPFALPEGDAVSPSGRYGYRLLALLPLAVLAVHLGSGISSAALLSSSRVRDLSGIDVRAAYFAVASLLLTTGLGVRWALPFTRILWVKKPRRPEEPAEPAVTPLRTTGSGPIAEPVQAGPNAGARPDPVAGRWVVFLSAKKLDPEGRNTRDIEIAEALYDFLTERGLNVFLSTRSLERMGAAAYKAAIDAALDEALVLVAVGTSAENLNSSWVKYEWDSFFNDIISGVKKEGRVFAYVEQVTQTELPRPLRQSEMFRHGPAELERLYSFIKNALPQGAQAAGAELMEKGPRRSSRCAGRTASLWKRPAGLVLLGTTLALLAAALWLVGSRPYRMARILSFYRDAGRRKQWPPASKSRPYNTGWVFLGYVEPQSQVFLEGPFAEVAYRATGTERGSIVPRIGDVLRISKDRHLVIADFVARGNANELVSPPKVHNILSDEDYTGEVLTAGSLAMVRDVDLGGALGRPSSVWCRVAQCDDTEGCAKARATVAK